MADDVLINKAATIEVASNGREEYDRDPSGFAVDFTRQDAVILNILRAVKRRWTWAGT